MNEKRIQFFAACIFIIALCQIIQTYHYIVTSAEAGRALPVIIEEISSRASNGTHTLPVEIRKPTKYPYGG